MIDLNNLYEQVKPHLISFLNMQDLLKLGQTSKDWQLFTEKMLLNIFESRVKDPNKSFIYDLFDTLPRDEVKRKTAKRLEVKREWVINNIFKSTTLDRDLEKKVYADDELYFLLAFAFPEELEAIQRINDDFRNFSKNVFALADVHMAAKKLIADQLSKGKSNLQVFILIREFFLNFNNYKNFPNSPRDDIFYPVLASIKDKCIFVFENRVSYSPFLKYYLSCDHITNSSSENNLYIFALDRFKLELLNSIIFRLNLIAQNHPEEFNVNKESWKEIIKFFNKEADKIRTLKAPKFYCQLNDEWPGEAPITPQVFPEHINDLILPTLLAVVVLPIPALLIGYSKGCEKTGDKCDFSTLDWTTVQLYMFVGIILSLLGGLYHYLKYIEVIHFDPDVICPSNFNLIKKTQAQKENLKGVACFFEQTKYRLDKDIRIDIKDIKKDL